MISRWPKTFCAAVSLLTLAGAMTPEASAADPTARPNVIIVMPDDVGYGDFACLGNPIIQTPAVDAFWKQSVRFTDFHVSAGIFGLNSAALTKGVPIRFNGTNIRSARR